MDYYQGVVVDYLRADRAVFVNTECCIQQIDQPNPDTSGPHWYCDAVAVDFRSRSVFLCEISYAKGLAALLKRLTSWSDHWKDVCSALKRDCKIPEEWHVVRPWLFVLEKDVEMLVGKLGHMTGVDDLPVFEPRITPLEAVQPWRYQSWNHQDKDTKKPNVPEAMRF